MPDALEQLRAEAEADLTAVLRRLNREGRKRIKAALAQYGSVQAIPQAVWEQLAQEVDEDAAAIMLLLMLGSYERTQRAAGTTPSETELAVAQERARPVAAAMGRDVATQYLDSARQDIATKLEAATEERAAKLADERGAAVLERPALPQSQRNRVINEVLDDEKLERTVSTSTTRGMTVGQVSAGNDEARRRGLAVDYKWRTERDARVCPICSPLDGKRSTDWEEILSGKQTAATIQQVLSGPPGHPNCRCKLEPYFPSGANYNSGPAFTVGGGVNVRN